MVMKQTRLNSQNEAGEAAAWNTQQQGRGQTAPLRVYA